MKREFLFLLLLCSFSNMFSQGTYGNSSYFNFQYSSVSDWTSFPGAASFDATVDGDQITFGNCNTLGPTRSKGGYTGAVRCQYIELPDYASLGYLSFYIQNGSSGTARNLYIKIWDSGSSSWVTTESYVIGGNEDLRISPSTVLSKKNVKVRIDSDGTYFWFYQLEAWSSTLETANVNEAPAMLSVDPADGAVIPSNGKVNIQFDEVIKAGSGSVSFSGGAVSLAYLGNTLEVTYSGLSSASNTLTIPMAVVLNLADVALTTDISINYSMDITPPVFQSVSPVDASSIVINDVLEKIVLMFDEAIALGAGTISFGPATVTPVVSGNTLVISYSGLAYSTPYTLTVPANMITDISGNAYASDIVINYTTLPIDATEPLLQSQSVTNGAINVPIGGSIYFTFDEIVAKGNQNVTLDGNPVTVSFNGSMMGVNYTNLDYNTQYTINIPAGSVTDTTGNEYAGTTFQFTTASFAAKDFDIIVAADGSGDYTTIQAAVNAVPDNSPNRTFIFVKSGTYTEKIRIETTKQNISLIGQDSSNTIITYNDAASTAGGTDASYTINVRAAGFYAENFKILNTFGQGSQAVALMTEGDRQVYKNCRMYGFQDTHYPKQANTRNYFLNCFIEGATDFIFGGATAYYENCSINCINGGQYITAPSSTTKEFGLVYNNCVITANTDVANSKFYLGRPWKDNAKTVWLNTKLDNVKLRPEGWAVWATGGDDADNHLTGFFAEYNTMDLSGTPYSPARAAWGVILTDDEASRYTIDNVFNYGTGLNTWNPLPYSTAPDAPENFVVDGGNLSWDASDFATGYLVFKNGNLLAITASTSYVDASSAGSDSYVVKAYNEYGAQSEASSWPLTGIFKKNTNLNVTLYPNPFYNELKIKSDKAVEALEFYNLTGELIKSVSAEEVVSVQDLESGIYFVKVILENGGEAFVKLVKP